LPHQKHPNAPNEGNPNQAQQKKQGHRPHSVEMQQRQSPTQIHRKRGFGKDLVQSHSGEHGGVDGKQVGKPYKYKAQKESQALLPEVRAKNKKGVHESGSKNR